MHIGSTSVDGMEAKPIIDISIGLKCLNSFAYYKEKFSSIFYKTESSYFENDWALSASKTKILER